MQTFKKLILLCFNLILFYFILFCFVLFCFVLFTKGLQYLQQAVNSDFNKWVRDFKFVFSLQIYALADCTMNSKFSILHSALPRSVLKISRSLYSQLVHAFVNKTLTSVSNP